MKRTIIEIPDPRLREKSIPVEKVDHEVRQLLKDMLETMYSSNGVGLAAPQVGVHKRIIVIDTAQDEPTPMCLVNPEIIWASDEKLCRSEGCLSVPNQYADVERFAEVKVKYVDENGIEQIIEGDELLGVALQHEIDHLDGIVFVDYLSPLKRKMLLKRLDKKRKQDEEGE